MQKEGSKFLRVTTNKPLLLMIITFIIAISSWSFFVVASMVHENQEEKINESKLDQILADSNKSDYTIIVVPNNSTDLNKSLNGLIK